MGKGGARGKEDDTLVNDSCLLLGRWSGMIKFNWAIVGHLEESPQSEGDSVPAI